MWLDLFMWGFSNGPASAAPYFAVIGSILLFVVAAPLALFLSRISSIVALVCAALIFPQPIYLLFIERSFGGFAFFACFPTVAGIIAARHLWQTRAANWLALRSSPRLLLRVPLACLPVAIFTLLFNARLIVSLLLEGPPR